MFSTKTYKERRARLMQQIDSGLILLLGNEESSMNYADNTYHFRQDSTFLYYFGISHPGLAAIFDLESGEQVIFGNDYTIDDIVWMGKQPTISDRAERSGINQTAPVSKLQEQIDKAKSSGRKIHFLPPYRPENKIKLFYLLGTDPAKTKEKSSVELVKAVVAQRNYKTAEEIVEIEKAVDITADMHLAAMRNVRAGMKEAEIAGMVQDIAIAAGGNISFPVIATRNGQTLHNHYHGNTLLSGDMLLLDCGAESGMGYAGDMSSTIPVDIKFTERQKEIYQITVDSHMAAVNALKPGVKFRDIHLLSCKTIVDGMKDLGFMKGDTEEAVAAGAHAMFFPCGLGHMMGLDVHDMEDLGEVYVGYDGKPKSTQFGLKSLRLARELEPGFVLTIEPGIYFIPDLIDQWRGEKKFAEFLNYDKLEEYKNFSGIRNEEDYLITKDGKRLLGKPLAKTIEEVEAERFA
jgi:Xaa-Pro aminopeptidase